MLPASFFSVGRFAAVRRGAVRTASLLLALGLAGGCKSYPLQNQLHAIGKGQRLEPSRPAPHHDVAKGGEEVVIAVTTDAAAEIVDINFIKRARSDAVNQYIAQSISDGFPRQPSMRTVVRLNHIPQGGFSEPQIVSSEPVATGN